jgi:glycerate kinase
MFSPGSSGINGITSEWEDFAMGLGGTGANDTGKGFIFTYKMDKNNTF